MPILKSQVKQETRVPKVPEIIRKNNRRGCLKEIELPACGRAKDIRDASQVSIPSGSQSRREKLPRPSSRRKGDRRVTSTYVPVVSATGTPLMPCHPARARELVRNKKAIRRFKQGIFYIKLTNRKNGNIQEIACGIDPGSKREAFTVKSKQRTFINILSDAIDTVKDKVKTRREMRRVRRFKNTPCRKNKCNKKKSPFPPSTKSRWQAKLRIINILKKLYPISIYIVEDIKAKTTQNNKRWNKVFSPLETGKKWFYSEIKKLGILILRSGIETSSFREKLGLRKNQNKLKEVFETHNIDSWVLANSIFNIQRVPDNTNIYRFIPLKFHRRQLHRLQPSKGGKRKCYGSTISLGIIRGTIVKHDRYKNIYVGGTSKGRLSIHDMETGKRLAQNIRLEDLEEQYKIKWRVRFLTSVNGGGSLHN